VVYDADYAERADRHSRNPLSQQEQSLIAAELAQSSPRMLLEVGCNTGNVLAELCDSLSADGVGVDVNPAAIRRAQSAWPQLDVFEYGGHNLPFDDDRFDHAIFHHVIGHVANPARLLQEILRVLRPGSTVSIITTNSWFKHWQLPFNILRRFHPDMTILRHYSRRTLLSQLSRAGFRVDRISLFGERATLCPPLIGNCFRLRIIAFAQRPQDEADFELPMADPQPVSSHASGDVAHFAHRGGVTSEAPALQEG